ncbi:MAG: nuclear transport factor 2 family protein [Bacteroidetes bacterium]|nr:nuclear transport factor 2 family protein [Bacteroidota bacterium]
MNKQLLIKSITTILFAAGCYAADAQDTLQTRKIIEQLEVEWHHAYIKHDSTILQRILAPEFINLGRTGGRLNKAQTLQNFRKDSATYEYCEPYDFEFRFFNNTVIVLCKSKEKGVDQGKPFSNIYFSYDVFVKRKKQWQCVQAGVSLLGH